ncbi:ABC transporter [Acetobacter malorum]|uniref:ABC transporter n=1 Tax=Acetobacter malorum TaxID=178901 RepID=A0A149UXA8_9PROT|nr:ABC transporter ATP-binding protein [Acetobacter malorum]KXV72578.1 ABC transporter [Acetobacter malorum]
MAYNIKNALNIIRGTVERNGKVVIDNVDFSINYGSWFSLIGANGSGKTSLLRALSGRLPFASGACWVNGEDLTVDRASRAKVFGFAPPADRLPNSVKVKTIFELASGDNENYIRYMGVIYEALELNCLLNLYIGDCSAGMKQRVALACAFARNQSIIILDEPFNWLDPVAIFDLRAALRKKVDEGLTLITALHDLNTLVSTCDSGLILTRGKIAMNLDEMTIQEAASNPKDFEINTINFLRKTEFSSGI